MKPTGTVKENVVVPDGPRIERRGPLRIAGIPRSFTSSSGQIATQWQRFTPHLGSIAGRVGECAYGVCIGCSGADTFEYLCGVEVAHGFVVPRDWSHLHIPAQTYAVFAHDGHVTKLRETIRAILEEWLPHSGHELAPTAAEVPDLFERYGSCFNPRTGSGDIEIWIAINPSTPGAVAQGTPMTSETLRRNDVLSMPPRSL
jgi:AraC family transcriptional regulator